VGGRSGQADLLDNSRSCRLTRLGKIRRNLSSLRGLGIGLVSLKDEVEEHTHLAVRLDRMP
jgi:hypothetical protein